MSTASKTYCKSLNIPGCKGRAGCVAGTGLKGRTGRTAETGRGMRLSGFLVTVILPLASIANPFKSVNKLVYNRDLTSCTSWMTTSALPISTSIALVYLTVLIRALFL